MVHSMCLEAEVHYVRVAGDPGDGTNTYREMRTQAQRWQRRAPWTGSARQPPRRVSLSEMRNQFSGDIGTFFERAHTGVCAAISRGWNLYWCKPRFLNWGPGPGLPDPSLHQYTFHPWEIRPQNPTLRFNRWLPRRSGHVEDSFRLRKWFPNILRQN